MIQSVRDILPYCVRRLARLQLLNQLDDCGFFNAKTKEKSVYNKAIVDLIKKDEIAMETFLFFGNKRFKFRNCKRDKEGKLLSVEAYLSNK